MQRKRISRDYIRKISLIIYGIWQNAKKGHLIGLSHVNVWLKIEIEANVHCENITVMQMHDWGWISAYLKEGIVAFGIAFKVTNF